VGGDLFDFVEVDTDTIGICVADVAGKGVPGSLIMTMIRTALRLEARGNKNPADVLAKVNRFVTDDMKRGMFVTMFYLVLDSRNRIIHYASAGHNPMILYRGSTKQTYYLNPSGFPVGIQLPDITLFDRKIEQDSIRLREDDLLVLYTDGVTEAMNTKRDLYREERFLDAIRQNAHFDVSDFIKAVRDDIKHHTQGYPQNDDITYVAVKEKLMQGEVIYSIQRELFRLIEEESVTVKDACEKMQVSPYMYRKYKKIKEDVGWEGLKDLLYNDDYIEKKHLSIETKTKLYDVIRNFPEYGAKRISDELNTEKYGFTKLEPRRIYEEMRKAKLSTREQRERYLMRGDKKRIKPPGTPLLTLDGQTILDYESAEQVIAKKRGTTPNLPGTPPPPPAEEKSSKVVHIASSPKSEKKPETVVEESRPETEKVSDREEATEEKQTPQPEAAEAQIKAEEPGKAAGAEAAVQEEEKAEELPEDEAAAEPVEAEEETGQEIEPDELEQQPAAAEKAGQDLTPDDQTPVAEDETPADLPEEKSIDDKAPEAETPAQEQELTFEEYLIQEKEKSPAPTEPVVAEEQDEIRFDEEHAETVEPAAVAETADEEISADVPDRLEIPSKPVDQGEVDVFYKMINDDIGIIHSISGTWNDGRIEKDDMEKILLSLRILTTHPLLKQLDNIKQLFVQVQKSLTVIRDNFSEIEPKEAIQNAKEMLKYIEKENILNNSKSILEQINEVGIQQQKLKSRFLKNPKQPASQLDAIRKKITQKNLIKNVSILESLSKSDRG
jgi:hypothetical protein